MSSPSADQLATVLEAQLAEIDRTEPAVREISDPTAVHEMRVALRRLRSILRAVRPLLDAEWVDRVREELEWIGDQLGTVRDLDVLSSRLRSAAAQLDGGDAVVATTLLGPLSADRDAARTSLLDSLESDRYQKLLGTLRQASASAPVRRDDLSIERLAAKEFRRVRNRGDVSLLLSNAALHKRRVRVKRARYAAELAAMSGGSRDLKRYVRATKEVQEVLGAHHDAVVARRRLRELARVSGRADVGVVAGRLIEREQRQIDDARKRVPVAWKRLRKRGDRVWRN
jgi:CHAD domain-containing protein